MEVLYNLMEAILPFQWMEYLFMKHAFLGIIIITPLFGLLGTMIVNNKMAFFSDALGHSALTGIALGTVFGLANTNLAMILFAVVFAILLNIIKRRRTVSTDTVISVFSSLSVALGLMLLSQGGDFAKYSSLLVGDILSITANEIAVLFVVFIATFLFWIITFNKIHAIGINESLARSKGMKIVLIEDAFSVLIAIIVMLSIRWVGIMIINALLILPAAAARNLASNTREYHLISIIISVFSGVTGLVVSYYLGTATGPTVAIIAAIIFFVTLWLNQMDKA